MGNPNIRELRPDRREAANASRIRLADAFVADLNEIIVDIQNLGISSLSGIASELNRRGIPTQRGVLGRPRRYGGCWIESGER